MAFKRRTGQRDVVDLPSAATLAIGDLVQYDEAGEIIVAVNQKAVLGIALSAATSSTNVLVDIIHAGDVIENTTVTGTVAANEIGNEADIASATNLTLTEVDGDALVVGWDGVTTSKMYVVFKNLAHGASGVVLAATEGLETT